MLPLSFVLSSALAPLEKDVASQNRGGGVGGLMGQVQPKCRQCHGGFDVTCSAKMYTVSLLHYLALHMLNCIDIK